MSRFLEVDGYSRHHRHLRNDQTSMKMESFGLTVILKNIGKVTSIWKLTYSCSVLTAFKFLGSGRIRVGTHWAVIFLSPGGANTIMRVKTRLTANITLLMLNLGSADNPIDSPIVKNAICEYSFDYFRVWSTPKVI